MSAKLHPDKGTVAENIAKKYFPCTCGEIYLSRKLTAPDCPYHAFDWEEAFEEYAATTTQGEQGFAWFEVPCSERLPECIEGDTVSDTVCVIYADGTIGKDWYDYYLNQWINSPFPNLTDVISWLERRPLPALYQEQGLRQLIEWIKENTTQQNEVVRLLPHPDKILEKAIELLEALPTPDAKEATDIKLIP